MTRQVALIIDLFTFILIVPLLLIVLTTTGLALNMVLDLDSYFVSSNGPQRAHIRRYIMLPRAAAPSAEIQDTVQNVDHSNLVPAKSETQPVQAEQDQPRTGNLETSQEVQDDQADPARTEDTNQTASESAPVAIISPVEEPDELTAEGAPSAATSAPVEDETITPAETLADTEPIVLADVPEPAAVPTAEAPAEPSPSEIPGPVPVTLPSFPEPSSPPPPPPPPVPSAPAGAPDSSFFDDLLKQVGQ